MERSSDRCMRNSMSPVPDPIARCLRRRWLVSRPVTPRAWWLLGLIASGARLIDALAAIERIERAGGIFVSVNDGLDLRTDTGRLVLRIMLSMAEYELDRIRGTWDAARAKAIERGVYMAPRAPTGY